jgi:hypothetical protein
MFFVAGIDREGSQQVRLERGGTARLERFLDRLMNTLQASAIPGLPVRIGLAQNTSNVIFDSGLNSRQQRVERATAERAEGRIVHEGLFVWAYAIKV